MQDITKEKTYKKYFVIPQKIIIPYQKEDLGLQKKQNKLIVWNTAITIILGTLAILAQLLEVYFSAKK